MKTSTTCWPIGLVSLVLLVLCPPAVEAQHRARNEVWFPNVPGWVTLKCDFHLHTVFSDGGLWPTLRVEEAWRDGLDVIAITDHVEYQPHKDDVSTNHNRSFDLALPLAKSLGLLLVKAAEITRAEPPGHWNALFLKEIAPLATNNYREAVRLAAGQGAFLSWNHPGWKQPDGKSVWYAEQDEVFKQGWLHGLEIVNGSDYDPIVHGWCLERGLTAVGNSDVHDAIAWNLDRARGEERPMTLVFATGKTEAAVKEALFARRTAVFANNMLIGDTNYLRPLFHGSIESRSERVSIRGKGRAAVQIYNRAPLSFHLQLNGRPSHVTAPRQFTLVAGKTVRLDLGRQTNAPSGDFTVALPYVVTNLLVAPGKGLPIELNVDVRLAP